MENYFISINIPEDVAHKMKNKLGDQFNRIIMGKMVPLEHYHITIKFFDNIDYKKLIELKKKISEVKFECFNIRIGKLKFIDHKVFGILLATPKSENLKKFAKIVWNIIGWDRRRFNSQITIMRTKKIIDLKKLNNIVKSLRFGNLEFDVKKFYLMKSTSNKKDSNYEVVQEYNLE